MKKSISLILSIMMIATLLPQVAFGAEEKSVITSFEELEVSDYYFEGNPEESELTLNLPETIRVNIQGRDEAADIPVTWESVEDYDSTDFYFYSMRPVWNDEEYTLSSELYELTDVPWITVYRQEPDNQEIEPILTEEDIQPVYTEEEGPVDPESYDDSSVSDVAKTLLDIFCDTAYGANNSNTDKIYEYLTKDMGLNRAAACGIMTNINAESGMSSNNLQNTYNSAFGLSDAEYTRRVDAGKGKYKTSSGKSKNFATDYAGYGLCQWTSNGRKANLLDETAFKGKSVSNIEKQLDFLEKELKNSYNSVYATIKNVPNTAGGAYAAAVMFCMAYEIPANTVNTATSRGKNCMSGYWKNYSGEKVNLSDKSFVSLCGYRYPTTLKEDKGMTVSGYAISNNPITSATAQILDSKGKAIYSKTTKPGTTAYKLYNFDSAMKFSKLSKGTYTYVITAKDSKGKTAKASHKFTVTSSGSNETDYGFAAYGVKEPEEEVKPDNNDKEEKPVVTKKTYPGTFPKLPKRGYFKKGDKGTQVKRLQKFLKWYGYDMSTGGTLGPATIKNIKKFQKKTGLKVDGVFGKVTLAKAKKVKK